jgi:hypothetical protein
MYDIQTDEELDAGKLRAKKGYGPEQAGDVLALTGSDEALTAAKAALGG